VGEIGALRGSRVRVIQRLDKSSARVSIYRTLTSSEAESVAFGGGAMPEVEVILRGPDLSNVADGQECRLSGCFIVSKTGTYTTATRAARTLHVIEPFDSTAAETIFRKSIARERNTERRIAAERDRAEARAKAERDAKRYAALLKNARSLIRAKLYDPAEKVLRRIIKEAPGTDAAADAQKELDNLPPH